MGAMIHRMTLTSNPRLLIFFTILIGLPLSGAASFSYFPTAVAAGALAIGGFLSYRLYRFALPYLGTKIETRENDILFSLPGEGDVSFPWKKVSLSGRCTAYRGRPFVFVYHAGRDKLITIPYEYTDMKGLESALEEKSPFEIFHFEPGMTLRGILKERFPQNGEKNNF
jgi:hypothetical protein